VKVLLNEFKTSGDHSIIFEALGLSSGTYFYQISIEDFQETKAMLFLK